MCAYTLSVPCCAHVIFLYSFVLALVVSRYMYVHISEGTLLRLGATCSWNKTQVSLPVMIDQSSVVVCTENSLAFGQRSHYIHVYRRGRNANTQWNILCTMTIWMVQKLKTHQVCPGFSYWVPAPHWNNASWCLFSSFPGSRAWVGKKGPGTHCLHMLSSPRISGNLEISIKAAPLH